jgi:hypothetical protein
MAQAVTKDVKTPFQLLVDCEPRPEGPWLCAAQCAEKRRVVQNLRLNRIRYAREGIKDTREKIKYAHECKAYARECFEYARECKAYARECKAYTRERIEYARERKACARERTQFSREDYSTRVPVCADALQVSRKDAKARRNQDKRQKLKVKS